MRILIAPDKLKGSLGAIAAAEAIARGIGEVWPEAELIRRPIADGGEGTAELVTTALGGKMVGVVVEGPLGGMVTATYGWIAEKQLAVMEMSAASGLHLIPAAADRRSLRDDGDVYRTYFTAGRGVEALGSAWTFLDLTPLGRQEDWEDSPAGYPQTAPYQWWRRHDEYDSATLG